MFSPMRAEHRVPEEAPANCEAPPYARVELTVTLPVGLERERMEARFRNGLLEVRIQRAGRGAATDRSNGLSGR